jgi:hypothetical protein
MVSVTQCCDWCKVGAEMTWRGEELSSLTRSGLFDCLFTNRTVRFRQDGAEVQCGTGETCYLITVCLCAHVVRLDGRLGIIDDRTWSLNHISHGPSPIVLPHRSLPHVRSANCLSIFSIPNNLQFPVSSLQSPGGPPKSQSFSLTAGLGNGGPIEHWNVPTRDVSRVSHAPVGAAAAGSDPIFSM